MTTCETCQGNGEIVTDWEEYLSPTSDLSGEAGTADCPDCDGGALQAHIDAQDAKIKALVGLMPEVLASLDATGCNVSLAKDLRAALAAAKETA